MRQKLIPLLVAGFLLATVFCINSTAWCFQGRSPNPFPRGQVFRPSATDSEKPAAFCEIINDADNPAYFYDSLIQGAGTAVYMNPAYCDPSPYPFKITGVHFYLYEFDPSNRWPVALRINIRDAHEGDSCQGPGEVICFEDVSVPADSAYPRMLTYNLSSPCCVYQPFFLEIVYTGPFDPNHRNPSPLMYPETPPPEACDNWFKWDGVYYEWHDFWAAPPPGDAIIRATGYTEDAECDTSSQAAWTFMVYLAADNNLEPAGIDDLNEMEIVGSNSQINIVVQIDRIPGYDNSNGDWTGTRRYYVTQDANTSIINSVMLQDLGEQNMGDPNVLKDFVDWTMTNYPADRYCLVLWDHGSGWHKFPNRSHFKQWSKSVDGYNDLNHPLSQGALRKTGGPSMPCSTGFPVGPPIGSCEGFKLICCDETDGDRLYNNELQQVLNQVPHLDILGFDACLMNMVETAYEVRGGADFMVGSEESEQGDGWPYDAILQSLAATPTMTPAKLCSTIVQKYGEFCDGLPMYNQTQSAVDLSQVLALKDRVNEFAQAMIAGNSWPQIEVAVLSSEHCQPPFDSYRDIHHFAHLVSISVSESNIITAANSVKSAIGNAIIRNYHGSEHPNFSGLSIYLPSSSTNYEYNYAQGSNIDFPTDTQWDEFLFQLFTGGGVTTDTYEPNDYSSQAYGPLTSGTAYQSYLPDSNDIDWYLLNFGITSDISVNLTVPGSADFDLCLLDANLSILCYSGNLSGIDESIDTTSVSPGTYYVVVLPYHSFSGQPYTLTATFSGGNMGSVTISYDDGDPYFGGYMTDFGDALCVALTPPTVPMKLEKILYNFKYLDAGTVRGDGSFYLYLMDYYGYLIDPFYYGLLTPPDIGWCYLDVSSHDITVYSDFFAGLIYDGSNTPCVGYDTTFSDRSFMWVANDQEWYELGWTLFIRAVVSYISTDLPEEEITEERPKIPELSQNYPNPFNPVTRLSYFIPVAGHVKLEILNILGRKIRTLVDEHQLVGEREVVWDGKNECGDQVASGVYLYRLEAGNLVQTRKMVLIR